MKKGGGGPEMESGGKYDDPGSFYCEFMCFIFHIFSPYYSGKFTPLVPGKHAEL